jgi:hypothetical protein
MKSLAEELGVVFHTNSNIEKSLLKIKQQSHCCVVNVLTLICFKWRGLSSY